MKFKCQNCGNTKYVVEKPYFVCTICGEKILESEMEEILANNQKQVDTFIKENEKLFEISFVPNNITNDELIKQLQDLKVGLLKELDEQGRLIKENQIDSLQEILQEKAKEVQVNLDQSVTLQELFDRAKDKSDYQLIAFIIRRNVEDNLIHKFNILHKGENFVMEVEEFENFCKSYTLCDGTKPFSKPKIKSVNYDGKDYISIHPIIRFVKAGLDYDDARKAAQYWGDTNSFIHSSDFNEKIAKKIMDNNPKEYFKKAVNFLKEKGLFTE